MFFEDPKNSLDFYLVSDSLLLVISKLIAILDIDIIAVTFTSMSDDSIFFFGVKLIQDHISSWLEDGVYPVK